MDKVRASGLEGLQRIEQSLFASRVTQVGIDRFDRDLEAPGYLPGRVAFLSEYYDLALALSEPEGSGI